MKETFSIDQQGAPGAHAPWRFASRGVAIRLFVTCWLVYALHFATNTVREIYPALTLGDRGSFDVSDYLGLHPDIFAIPGRGAYINNNPGASIMGAAPYALARPLINRAVAYVQLRRAAAPQGSPEYDTIYPMAREFHRQAYERGLDIKFGLAAGVMQLLLMAPLSALSVVLMFYILMYLTSSVRQAFLLALLYGFATPVFYRTAQLNHNLLVGHCAFLAFAVLWRPWNRESPPRRWHYLLSGLLAGWAVVLDYSGVIVLLGIGLYALARWRALPKGNRGAGDLALFGAASLASLAVLLVYQWGSFGNPFYPAQHYMPPTTYSGYGYAGLDWPKLDLVWENLFGLRYGLFTSAPILLLSLYAPAWLSKRSRIMETRETWFALFLAVAFLLFTAANQFSRMQFNSGVRHMVPVTPFVFILAASTLLCLRSRFALFLGIVATYWSWCLAMYRDVEQGLGVLEALWHITTEGPRLPWLVTLEQVGYVSKGLAAPLILILAVTLWLLWKGAGATERAYETAKV